LGLGLREETGPIAIQYPGGTGLIMASSAGLAERYFPQLDGWVRVLGAPSLADLAQRAEAAAARGLAYEALGYGLETSKTTPDGEWQDVVGSTERARALADQYGKLLVMGPGFRLMSLNWEHYPEMAALADVWLLQTQRLQINPPGPDYRREVERVVTHIRSGNPDILIWAQITLPPDRPPDAGEWLAYHASIADLLDGATYVGAYTWDIFGADQLVPTIEAIFAAACDGGG
jgi:hypothetical protein